MTLSLIILLVISATAAAPHPSAPIQPHSDGREGICDAGAGSINRASAGEDYRCEKFEIAIPYHSSDIDQNPDPFLSSSMSSMYQKASNDDSMQSTLWKNWLRPAAITIGAGAAVYLVYQTRGR